MKKGNFVMYDPDEARYITVPTNNIVSAIYYAWNYEFEVFESQSKNLIFTPFDNNEWNSEFLRKYGLRMIDYEGHRVLQCIETNEIYKAPWREENE